MFFHFIVGYWIGCICFYIGRFIFAESINIKSCKINFKNVLTQLIPFYSFAIYLKDIKYNQDALIKISSEIFMGLFTYLLLNKVSLNYQNILILAFFIFFLINAISDVFYQLASDFVSFSMLLISVAFVKTVNFLNIKQVLFESCLFLLLIYCTLKIISFIKKKECFGIGDLKVIFVLCMMFGAADLSVIILLASILTLIFGCYLIFYKKYNQPMMPFLPFLLIASCFRTIYMIYAI